MTTAPTQHPFGEAWIAAYFADVDRLDPAAMLRWYTEDGSFRFAGRPALKGKAAIAEALSSFYKTIRGMRHQKTGFLIDEAAGTAAWEADVTFTRLDGSEVTMPAVSVIRLRDGLVSDFRFVMDPAPIYGASE